MTRSPEPTSSGFTVFAPAGIGEVRPGDDLVELVGRAVEADPHGPLAAGDVVVVTSKIVSKAEGRSVAAAVREDQITAAATRTVARRGATRIVRTATGLTLAAAGVDASNVPPGRVLLLPADPDASAARLRRGLEARSGVRLGVIVSDTAGRAWRHGQTDQAIGAAGVRVVHDYAGRHDPYGNELVVTATAVADEIAAAADLAKGKLAGRPVAVVRGLGPGVLGGAVAADLVRPPEQDLFGYGTREAVLAAVCAVVGLSSAYEELVALAGEELIEAVLARAGRDAADRRLLADLLRVSAHPAAARLPDAREADRPRRPG